jgi:hypothetical protein
MSQACITVAQHMFPNTKTQKNINIIKQACITVALHMFPNTKTQNNQYNTFSELA